MAVLRTKRLAYGAVRLAETKPDLDPRADIAIFTCPAGQRAIVRDFRLFLWTAATVPESHTALLVQVSGFTPTIAVWSRKVTQHENPYLQDADIVLDPGDRLIISSLTKQYDYYVSGALLTIPTQ